MSLFFPAAYAAEGAPPNDAGVFANLMLIVAFIGVFYFLIWRPQSKRAKEQRTLIASLSVGDEIVTAGGFVGQITKVEDDFVVCKFADNVNMRLQKHAVSATLPKGTLKSLNEK